MGLEHPAGSAIGDSNTWPGANYNVLMDFDFSGTIEQDEYDRCQSGTGIAALDAGAISDPDFDEGPWSAAGYDGYIYDDIADLSCVRFRWYDAGLGRWMTRDPAGYVDGENLYQYVRSSPFTFSDALGLWSWKGGKRQGEARAVMIADEGDTTETAAKFTELSATDTEKWLLHILTGAMIAPGEEIVPCDEYSVPNTVYVTLGDLTSSKRKGIRPWLGIPDRAARWGARWQADTYYDQMKQRGYRVYWQPGVDTADVRSYLSDPDIVGWFHTSHGDDGFLHLLNEEDLGPSDIRTAVHHKLAFITLMVCDAGQHRWEAFVSENGTYRARCGTINPVRSSWRDIKPVPVDQGCGCP